MKIKTIQILLGLLFFGQGLIIAQDNVHQTVLWRGYEHSWTYNHRINRLGNYVESVDDKMRSTHVSASGLGADSTFYTSHYTFIDCPTVGFHAGKVEIKLYGKEKQLLTKRIEVSVPAPEGMKNKEHYITMLNGFDLKAVDRADKIKLLRLSVEDAEYAPAINEIRFYLKVALVVNCQSLECSRFNQQTTYDLNVRYLIAAGDIEDLDGTPKTLTKYYPWGKKDEFHHTAEKHHMFGRKGYNSAALGIKSMALTLDSEHWTVQYNNNITPLAYDEATARMDFSLDLFFKEWQQGMKTHSARPDLSKFSSKKKGWCVLDLGVVLLQFKDAKIVHQKHKGSLYWVGNNAASSDSRAVSTKDLKFPID